jgi:stage V sporulation protein D (sporulation-specific penicillin-binding protein)
MRPRIQAMFLLIVCLLGVILLRLAYWQIVRGGQLRAAARSQYSDKDVEISKRGEIITSDESALVINRPVYNLGVYLPGFTGDVHGIPSLIGNVLEYEITDPAIATDPARAPLKLTELKTNAIATMSARLAKGGYATLAQNISEKVKTDILATGITGLTFDQDFTRSYPEASLSAHVTGFVGRDESGEPLGYFGLEGYYNRELESRVKIEALEKDALGNPLLTGSWELLPGRVGRSLKLHLDRGVQHAVVDELQKAITRYGAVSGEVVVMDPATGGILAMSSLPTYDPSKFHLYDSGLYKNPSIANTYEPGSTFKVLVAASAFNEGVIQESDHCDICSGPVQIDKYSIKTWNGEYRDSATPEDIIVHSDNTGMVWMQRKLGGEKLVDYIQKFGFGEKTGIDLQEEVASPLRKSWGEVDYATSSFGQGIAVTSIQMVRAVGAIANGGRLMEPHVVSNVQGDSDQSISPKVVRQVISKDAAQRTTDLMIKAVEYGEAKWAKPKGYTMAGKTGTAQIAVAGNYDEEKTIASFVIPASSCSSNSANHKAHNGAAKPQPHSGLTSPNDYYCTTTFPQIHRKGVLEYESL